jgi:hypothetical protein
MSWDFFVEFPKNIIFPWFPWPMTRVFLRLFYQQLTNLFSAKPYRF